MELLEDHENVTALVGIFRDLYRTLQEDHRDGQEIGDDMRRNWSARENDDSGRTSIAQA